MPINVASNNSSGTLLIIAAAECNETEYSSDLPPNNIANFVFIDFPPNPLVYLLYIQVLKT